jgi:hypothetical protein
VRFAGGAGGTGGGGVTTIGGAISDSMGGGGGWGGGWDSESEEVIFCMHHFSCLCWGLGEKRGGTQRLAGASVWPCSDVTIPLAGVVGFGVVLTRLSGGQEEDEGPVEEEDESNPAPDGARSALSKQG